MSKANQAKLTEFEVLLTHIINKTDLLAIAVEKTDKKIELMRNEQALMKKNQDVFLHIMRKAQEDTDQFKQSEKMFKACHTAFVQVREACTCLREELGEATGSIIQDSWPCN